MEDARKGQANQTERRMTMGLLAWHSRHLGLVAMLLLGVLGCAHTPLGPAPLPAEVREQLGRIGVAYQGPASLTVWARPVRGAGEGAGKGAMEALGGAAAFSGGGMGALGVIILSPGIAALGALVGAALAPSAAAVADAEVILDQVVADPDIPVAVRDHILQAVHIQRPQAVLLLPEPDAAAEDEAIAQAARSREGIDTVLEVSGPTIYLRKRDYAGDINPSLRLSVSLYCRVMRSVDRALLYTYSPEYHGEARTFTAWAANNAQAFRQELDRASETLARQIVAQLFGPDPSLEKESVAPQTLAHPNHPSDLHLPKVIESPWGFEPALPAIFKGGFNSNKLFKDKL
jgi:hypothetical protein